MKNEIKSLEGEFREEKKFWFSHDFVSKATRTSHVSCIVFSMLDYLSSLLINNQRQQHDYDYEWKWRRWRENWISEKSVSVVRWYKKFFLFSCFNLFDSPIINFLDSRMATHSGFIYSWDVEFESSLLVVNKHYICPHAHTRWIMENILWFLLDFSLFLLNSFTFSVF